MFDSIDPKYASEAIYNTHTIIKNICTAYDLVNWSSINLVFESSLSYLLNVILS